MKSFGIKIWGLLAAYMLLVLLNACSSEKKGDGNSIGNSLLWEREIVRLDAILNSLPDDFKKTSFLREYCGELIDLGRMDSLSNSYYNGLSLDNLDLPTLYPLFKNDSIAAQCGLTSLFYIKLVQHFGYSAYQYSFGFNEAPYTSYIHSFPLVKIKDGGIEKLIVQDPYLNLTIRDSLGNPLDFYRFLTAAISEKEEVFDFDTVGVFTKLRVRDTARLAYGLTDSCRTLLRKKVLDNRGELKNTIPILRNYSTLMQSPCNNFERKFVEVLKANGYYSPFYYAYSIRVNTMAGSMDVESVQQKIDTFIKNEKAKGGKP